MPRRAATLAREGSPCRSGPRRFASMSRRGASWSVLHPEADARDDRQVVRVRLVSVIEVVGDAVHVALVIDVENVEVRAQPAPAELPGLVHANVEGMKERQARLKWGISRERKV